MKKTYFETIFGEKIELIPGSESTIYGDADNMHTKIGGYMNTAYEVGEKVKFDWNIREDIDTFAKLIDLLKEVGILNDRQFKRGLDLAGAEGIHASLLRGLYAEKVTVADIRDGRDTELSRKLRIELLKRYRRYQFFDKLIERRWLKKIPFSGRDLPRRMPDKHLNRATSQSYYNFNFRRTPTVDEFLVGDWRKTISGQYDFIMNFQSFWLFDPDEALRLISSKLEKNGILAIHAPYYWAGRPSGDAGGMLCGDFGFFEQRLTLEDITRYYTQYKPNLVQYVERAYNVTTPVQPTVNMYMDIGLKNGLSMLGYNRIYHRQPYNLVSKKHGTIIAKAATNKTQNAPDIDADEVLRDIHHTRPDIQLIDLLTRAVVMVFQKNS